MHFNYSVENVLYWLPRVFTILFILFLGFFSLDALIPGGSIDSNLLLLAIHLIPVYILSLALFIAWRQEDIGALIFIALSFLIILMSDIVLQVIFSTGMITIGILFLLHYLIVQESKKFRRRGTI